MDRLKRLRGELLSIEQESDDMKKQLRIEVEDDDMRQVTAFISGPPDSPFAGGTFRLLIEIPNTYPFDPPRVTFLTKIWHPNISARDGYVCLDTLGHQWSPAFTLKTLLLTLQVLLQEPCAKDPLNYEVARQIIRSRDVYHRTARFWTKEYAMDAADDDATASESEDEILIDMVIGQRIKSNRNAAINYLSRRDWNLADFNATEPSSGPIRHPFAGRGASRRPFYRRA